MVKKRATVALFGGSFDPPHKGHQAIAKKVASLEDIDKLIVMPAFLNPFKSTTLAPAKKRLEWCQIVFDAEKIIISDFEIKQKRPVYTIETINTLTNDYIVKYLVIGSDNLENIQKWKSFEQINQDIIWLVATRGEQKLDYSKLFRYRIIEINEPISSTVIRQGTDIEMVDDRIRDSVKDITKTEKRTTMTIKERVDNIVNILDNKKAEEIEVFDLHDTDYIAQEVVIANSLGGKHTLALHEHLKKELKPKGEQFLGSDESDDWVVADLGDIIVHIMTPAYREHYSLEKFLSELKPTEA